LIITQEIEHHKTRLFNFQNIPELIEQLVNLLPVKRPAGPLD